MARKLSPITTAEVNNLSEIAKGKVEKAERQRKMAEKMSFTTIFNIWRCGEVRKTHLIPQSQALFLSVENLFLKHGHLLQYRHAVIFLGDEYIPVKDKLQNCISTHLFK